MSDMNLPTVTFDTLDDTVESVEAFVRPGSDEGYAYIEFPYGTYAPPNGTYVLVPVDAMERVWWCEVHQSVAPSDTDDDWCEMGDTLYETKLCHLSQKWLVSAKEEE